MILLVCFLLAVGLLAWIFLTLHHVQAEHDRDGKNSVVSAAEQLRGALERADADGVLTDREVAQVLGDRPPLSLNREANRTDLVVQVATSGWAQCYTFTVLGAAHVTSRPLDACPPSTPSVSARPPSVPGVSARPKPR
ncbi:hypothetical protein ABZX93_11830 [Streptomyces sp. NPDC006632]|uniref:hypothetical protein n=1 Tax=Streptomyces sp. NPDC006632 TaxID=3157182 RepID=UPI0033B40B65